MEIPAGRNADYYQGGRANARYYRAKPAAVEPPYGTPAYWSNEGVKDVVSGFPSRTGVETTLNDAEGNPLPVQYGGPQGGQAPAGYPRVRPAPVYVPKGDPGSGVFVPPPGPVVRTFEVYALMRGRPVGWNDVTRLVGGRFQVDRGARLLVANSPNEGFGLAGQPGAWSRFYPTTSPANFALDGDTGVLGWDPRQRRGYAIGASQLVELFGPSWRTTVYH